jgi:uncharacterized membrane protein
MDAPAAPLPAAAPVADAGRVWVLKRNCRLAPGELAIGCLLPCVFGAAAALVFLVAGYPLVSVFVSVEMLALGAAFIAYARHAADHDTLTLKPGVLEVEQWCGGRVRRASFNPAWVRVQVEGLGEGRGEGGGPSPIRLSAGGTAVEVGRHIAPQARISVEHELRAALRAARS